MPADIAKAVEPGLTALLLFEMQRGVAGDLHASPELGRAVADAGLIDRLATLAEAARTAGVRVVHCVIEWRADRAGTLISSPLVAVMARRHPEHILTGTDRAAIIPALGPDERDLVSVRTSGLTPFMGTGLDPMLRAHGIRTVVATGVGLTVGLLGLAIEAVNLGYRVVIPADGVVDADPAYGAMVWDKTIPLLANRTTIAELLDAWGAS